MFENLSDRLERSFKILKGEGKITEINVAETMKDVRRALLDADVNYKVAKEFTNKVKEKALGMNVLTAVKPGQLMIKLVHDELEELMGGEEAGGIGIAAHMPERDGILACLILCELMAKTDAPLGVLVDQLEDSFGKTSYGRRDLRLEAEDAETLRTLLPGVNPKSICGKVPQNVSHMDGLRLSFEDDTWLLVRPSGTEPVVRVYAEGFSVEERDELLDAGCALARGTYPL